MFKGEFGVLEQKFVVGGGGALFPCHPLRAASVYPSLPVIMPLLSVVAALLSACMVFLSPWYTCIISTCAQNMHRTDDVILDFMQSPPMVNLLLS